MVPLNESISFLLKMGDIPASCVSFTREVAAIWWQVWGSWRPRGDPVEYLTQPYGAAQIGAPKPSFRVFARAPRGGNVFGCWLGLMGLIGLIGLMGSIGLIWCWNLMLTWVVYIFGCWFSSGALGVEGACTSEVYDPDTMPALRLRLGTQPVNRDSSLCYGSP